MGLVIGIVSTAVMLVLALPLGEQFYLIPFSVVPLLVATRDKGFLYGFVGALLSIFLAAWISSTGVLYANPDPEGTLGWVYTGFGLFGFSFSIVLGMAAEKGAHKKPAWWYAAAATLLEACLLVELPAHLALALYRHLPALLVSSVGGIWLVSFLVWWANFALARLPMKSFAWGSAGLAVLLLATKGLTLTHGGETRLLAAIQVPEADEEQLLALHKEASAAGAEMVVWPEFSAIGLVIDNDTSRLREISSGSSPFVTTFRDTHEPMPHNVAALFERGQEKGRYFKRKPFGAEKSMHAAGDRPGSAGLVGLNICFDSCYPHVIRDSGRLEDVNLLALPTIDPPAPNHFLAKMHSSFTPFRAAENGLPIVRADGYAYSQIVDARGVIVAEAPPGVQALIGDTSVRRRWTVYRILGDWFLFICVALVLGGWIGERVKRSA